MEVVRYQGHPTTVSLFYNSVFILLVFLLVNHLLAKVFPRCALHRNEMLVIYLMVTIASALGLALALEEVAVRARWTSAQTEDEGQAQLQTQLQKIRLLEARFAALWGGMGAVAEAERQIRLILNPPTAEVGAVYPGRVVNITKFGAFVNILPGRDGLVHISKMGGGKRIERVEVGVAAALDDLANGEAQIAVVHLGHIGDPAGDLPAGQRVDGRAVQADRAPGGRQQADARYRAQRRTDDKPGEDRRPRRVA